MHATTQTRRLALDLDGVLTEHPRPLARAAAARFGLDLPESAFIDSAGLNVPQAVRDWVYGDDGPAAALEPAPGAPEFLAGIVSSLGADNVRIVTARPESASAMTRAWLRRHGFPEVAVIFADDKCGVAAREACAIAVEDSRRHARNYAAAGVTCYLLGAGDAEDEAGIVRVAALADVARALGLPGAEQPMRDDPLNGPTAADAAANGRTAPDAAPAEEAAARPKIVVSDAIHPLARERLQAHAELVDVDGTDVPSLLAAVTDADALVVRSETQVTEAVLAAAPRLRVVARAGVGIDNIDVPAATRAGVLVLNAPGANAVSAGEHTIALLLAITREIPRANASTHAGKWERKRMRPVDLRGRTVGIVGLGHVGSVVAQRLRGFGMRLIAHDPYITPERFADLGVEPVAYETLLATADVVTYHVPLTSETLHMLNAETIAQLKPGAIVLNCARGEVVDPAALADALGDGRVAAAGVDVFPHEPCTENPLFPLPNAILTPHIGGSSPEALAAIGEMISTTTLDALRGEAVPNAVNLPAASLHAPELQRLTTVAGAAGRLLAILRPDLPPGVTVTVRGLVPQDVSEHVTAAALTEALQIWTDRRVTPVNARLVAQEVGLQVRTTVGETDPERLPRFTFEASGDPAHRVTVTWDRTNAGILEVDRFSLERPLAGDVLITHHRDQPGVIGRVGTILGRYEVNIAGMQVGRHRRGGEAIMVLNVDDAIPDNALIELRAIPGLIGAYVVSLPPAAPLAVFDRDLAGVGLD